MLKFNSLNFKDNDLFTDNDNDILKVNHVSKREIAIIGVSAKFPLAGDVEEFWNNVKQGIDCITYFPDCRKRDIDNYLLLSNTYSNFQKSYGQASYMDRIDLFDYEFFKLSPKEASLMDPCQRLFLQTTWQAIEDSGYGEKKLSGTKTGVYVGFSNNLKDNYHKMVVELEPSSIPLSITGNMHSVIPSRIAYILDLKGPAMAIDTACSSSLVAVHLACQGINNGDCDMAIAGGVRINLQPLDDENLMFGIESSDGRTRAFDDKSDGSGVGEGVAAILLKPLWKAVRDGDYVYAVVKGSAINQDGSSMELTAPNPEAQSEVIAKAWENSGINPETIAYIETHGTGTRLGDPIEIAGIEGAFRRYTNKRQFCAISSLKSNYGHMFECAGIAGLLKAVIALQNKEIPPTMYFNEVNKKINFENSPVYVNKKVRSWEEGETPRRCGVSAFALSGTNCHVVLEEAPKSKISRNVQESINILTISATSENSLKKLVESYKGIIKSDKDLCLRDICYTANTSRGQYSYRLAILFNSREQLRHRLELINEVNLEINNNEGIFFGYKKAAQYNNKINEEDVKNSELHADTIMNAILKSDEKDESLLIQLCMMYTSGSNINWDNLYRNKKVNCVRIPVYPFEESRCWILPQSLYTNKEGKSNNLFHTIRWQEEQKEECVVKSCEAIYMIIYGAECTSRSFAANLSDMGIEVIEVVLSQEYKKISDNNYKIGFDEEDYLKLFKDIGNKKITKIIHLATLEFDKHVEDIDELYASQRNGVYSLYFLTRAVVKQFRYDVDIVIVSDNVYKVDGREKVIKAENASLFGLGKVVSLEYPEIRCRSIDVDKSTYERIILDEIMTDCKNSVVAYRENRRYIQEFDVLNLESKKEKLQIKSQGVYLITGGTGGIGLEIAKYLSLQGAGNIALVSRSKQPSRDLWEDILLADRQDKTKKIIQAILEIERNGSKISTYSLDISKPEDVNQLITELRKTYTKINGIIHSAGVPGDGYIVRREKFKFDEVLNPKIYGTWLLDEATKDDGLDFFVNFSSGLSILGEQGHGDYVAANSYLDAFADYRVLQGRRTITIGWSAWKSVGTSVEYGFNVDKFLKAILTEQAISAFSKILNTDVSNVIIGELNIVNSQTKIDEVNIVLKGRVNNDYSETEKKLGQILGKLLGFKEIDVYENFFELGVDSISMMKIITEINNNFGVEINFSIFAEGMDAERLSKVIESKKETNKRQGYPEIVPDPENMYEPFPLTEVQMAYLMGRNGAYEMGGFSTHAYVEVEIERDIKRLNNALQKLINHHPMLRAIILPDGRQQILRDIPEYEIKIDDIRKLSNDEQNEYILKERNRMSHYVFKHDVWPLFEVKALRTTENKHYLFIGLDLLIADGVSIQIINQQLMDLYVNPDLELPKSEITFRDYIQTYEIIKKTETYANDKLYWMKKLEDFPSAPTLPLKQNPSNIEKPLFKRYYKAFDRKSWSIIKKESQKHNVTTSALLCTAYAEVLAFWCNQSKMAINLAAYNRYPIHKDVEKIIGDFTSVMLLDIDTNSASEFWEKAKFVQKTLLEVLEHRHYDGVEFTRELANIRNYGSKSVMPVVFTSMLFDDSVDLQGMLGEEKMGITQTPQVYLDNQIRESNGELYVTWDYVSDILDEELVGKMFKHFTGMISSIISGVTNPSIEIPVEDKEIIKVYNRTEQSFELKTLHGAFMKQASRVPDKQAIVYEGNSITYKELDERSNKIANFLIKEGIKRNDLVGVLAKRCIETIVNILGILKAGAAYVPIDPSHPFERREYILSNSNCKLLLDAETFKKQGVFNYPERLSKRSDYLDDVAYVIYTSGSTGSPKGVVITHRSAFNTIIDINIKYDVNEDDRIIGLSSMCFDLSVYDIFGALSTGATLVMIPDQRDVTNLIDVVDKENITIWNSVPAIMDMTIQNISQGFVNKSLRLVLLSGDWIPLRLPMDIKKVFISSQVISLGGATEAAIWSIYYPINYVDPNWTSIPYGSPLANQGFYVLNKNMEVCPIDVEGELFISGLGLSQGYCNNDEKTLEAFIKHPVLGQLYKTGDYGVMRRNGYIEFLGRKDFQVKIRGYRVELGEIEAHLLKQKGVKNAVVVDCDDKHGGKHLCAYIVSEVKLNFDEIRSELLQELPEYMVPMYYKKIDDIPLSTNGKVDKKSLPEFILEENHINHKYQAPRNEIEKKLVSIYKSVLKVDNIGVFDDIFILGAHSISVITLASKIFKEFNVEIPLREIFRTPAISNIAEYISQSKTNIYTAIQKCGHKEYYSISSAQNRLFVVSRILKTDIAYNIYCALKIDGYIDSLQFEKAIYKLIERHEALRTSFELTKENLVQKIHDIIDFRIDYFEATDLEVDGIIDKYIRPFNLETYPLFRVGLIKIEEQKHILVYDVHHAIADGQSIDIIMRDFFSLYNNADIPELTIQYKDFVEWQNQLFLNNKFEAQLNYWLNLLSGYNPNINMPTDYQRPELQSFEGSNLYFKLEDNLIDSIRELMADTGTTLYMILFSAYNILISKYSRSDDIVIGTPVSGRFYEGLNDIVGMFVNTLPLRNRIEKHKEFVDFLYQIKQNTLEAFANQSFQYEELINKLDLKRDSSRNLLFDASFAYQSMEYSNQEFDEMKITPYIIKQKSSKFDFEMQVLEKGKEVTFNLVYCTKIYKQETIEQIISDYIGILKVVVTKPEILINEIKLESCKDVVTKYEIVDEEVYFNFDL